MALKKGTVTVTARGITTTTTTTVTVKPTPAVIATLTKWTRLCKDDSIGTTQLDRTT